MGGGDRLEGPGRICFVRQALGPGICAMAGWVPDGWETQAQGQGRDDQVYRRDRGQGGGYGGGHGGGCRRNDDRRRGGMVNPYEVRLPHFLEYLGRSPSVRTTIGRHPSSWRIPETKALSRRLRPGW